MEFTDKIEQYLEGEMTPEELANFEKEMKTNPEFANEVRLHQLAIAGIQHKEEKGFQSFKKRMSSLDGGTDDTKQETPVVPLQSNRSGSMRWLIGIAAMLLLAVGAYALWSSGSNQMESVSAELIAFNLSGTKGSTPNSSKTKLQQGIQYFKNKDYTSAISLFDHVIINNREKRATALFLKADALLRIGKKKEASLSLPSIEESDDARLYGVANEMLERGL